MIAVPAPRAGTDEGAAADASTGTQLSSVVPSLVRTVLGVSAVLLCLSDAATFLTVLALTEEPIINYTVSFAESTQRAVLDGVLSQEQCDALKRTYRTRASMSGDNEEHPGLLRASMGGGEEARVLYARFGFWARRVLALLTNSDTSYIDEEETRLEHSLRHRSKPAHEPIWRGLLRELRHTASPRVRAQELLSKHVLLRTARHYFGEDGLHLDHLEFHLRLPAGRANGEVAHAVHADNCRVLAEGDAGIYGCQYSHLQCCAWRSHTAFLYLTDSWPGAGGQIEMAPGLLAPPWPHGLHFRGTDDEAPWGLRAERETARNRSLEAIRARPDRPAVLPAARSGIELRSAIDGSEMEGRADVVAVSPRCGRLVTFTSGVENPHLVRQLAEGERMALAAWLTLDRSRVRHGTSSHGRGPLWVQAALDLVSLVLGAPLLLAACAWPQGGVCGVSRRGLVLFALGARGLLDAALLSDGLGGVESATAGSQSSRPAQPE